MRSCDNDGLTAGVVAYSPCRYLQIPERHWDVPNPSPRRDDISIAVAGICPFDVELLASIESDHRIHRKQIRTEGFRNPFLQVEGSWCQLALCDDRLGIPGWKQFGGDLAPTKWVDLRWTVKSQPSIRVQPPRSQPTTGLHIRIPQRPPRVSRNPKASARFSDHRSIVRKPLPPPPLAFVLKETPAEDHRHVLWMGT